MALFPQEGCIPEVTAPFSLEELGQSHKAERTPTVSGHPWADIHEMGAIWAPLLTLHHPGSGFCVQDAQPQTFRANSQQSHVQSSLCRNGTLSMPSSAMEPYIIFRENSTPGVRSKTSLNQSQLLDSSFCPALAQANLNSSESSLPLFPHFFLVIPGRNSP